MDGSRFPLRQKNTKPHLDVSDSDHTHLHSNFGLTTKEALMKLHHDMKLEIVKTKNDFSKRKLLSWLRESVSFESELSKMRWPSVVFMTAQAVVHFIVAFILNVDNIATNWVGFQGFILTILLAFNLTVNIWDTKLRYKELLMKSEQLLALIEDCYNNKNLLKQWTTYNWQSARAKTLFIPKSPCVHQTLTYRDESCLNLPDYLLVRGDIIHLFPGERAPGDCISLKALKMSEQKSRKMILKEGQIYNKFHRLSSQSEKYSAPQEDPNISELLDGDKVSKGRNYLLHFGHAKLKRANKGADFLMLSTPYIKSLRISLQRSHRRPVNSVEKECFIISRKYFETFVIPLVFLLSTIVTAIHYGYLDLTDNEQKIKTISITHLLLRPSLTIMPFLPWMFPCLWLTVNAYGSARILCCGEALKKAADSRDPNSKNYDPYAMSTYNHKFDNLLATPTAGGSSENKQDEAEFLDLQSKISQREIIKTCFNLIEGKSGHVWRSSSLLQVLGSLTSLCCIDKVGILSWSNPTPEKVFLLTRNHDEDVGKFTHNTSFHRNQHQNLDGTSSDLNSATDASNNQQQNMITINSDVFNSHLGSVISTSNTHDPDQVSNNQPSSIHTKLQHSFHNSAHPEILDISQINTCFKDSILNESAKQIQQNPLQFDDLNWTRYITNLKPLGLAILMNNCCEKSFGDYFRFYKHISYESILRCNLTPVVKRRCICSIAKLIGFSQNAVNNYKYINQIGLYKLIDISSIKKGKLVSSLENTTKLKLPFPNMTCNIHQDIDTGGHQVFSQGTADIILDACVEYWDGKQLMPLDESCRKKIMDFYHRSSLTSYCSAFAYTPLLKKHNLSNHYVELPPENSKFAPQLRTLANENQEEFLQNQIMHLAETAPYQEVETNFKTNSTNDDSHISSHEEDLQLSSLSNISLNPPGHNQEHTRSINITRRHLSVEDLNDDTKEKSNGNEKKKYPKKTRGLNETLDELTDQVFVGMVALQYQACPDFVALVEQLEHACIRFVHFSKENELRSRVFSEKMGLESGWNCHISLQSEEEEPAKNQLYNGKKVQDSPEQTTLDDYERKELSNLNSFCPTTRISNILKGQSTLNESYNSNDMIDIDCNQSISSDERTLNSWKSLPSIVMKLTARIASEYKTHANFTTPDHNKMIKVSKTTNQPCDDSSGDNTQTQDQFVDVEMINENHDQSNTEDAYQDDREDVGIPPREGEGFESIAFDMSNRAKLPKGIKNIRPHLQTVDNVPLQVSLFTDCNPELTQEMIEIMQEYGEIVCVIGSASSRLNTGVFLQANASIGLEPLLPQCCMNGLSDSSKKIPIKRNKKNIMKRSTRRNIKRNKRRIEIMKEATSDVNRLKHHSHDRLGVGYKTEVRLPDRSSNFSNSSSSTFSSLTTTPSSSSSSSSSEYSSYSSSEDELEDQRILDENNFLDNDQLVDNQTQSQPFSNDLPSPTYLASKLASLPCSYSYNRKDSIDLYRLIMEARHFTFKMKNTFVCMICFALSISSAQFLTSLVFLPPMLSSGLTIWLTVVVVPLMSFSLMSTSIDSQVMKIAVGKNLQLKPENIKFFVICYLIKFIPSIIVVVISFGLIIAHSCKLTGFGSSSLGPCWMFTYVQHNNTTSPNEDLLWSTHLLTAQVCAAFLLVFYFVVISAGFVHRSHLLWERSPTRNGFWVAISLLLIFGQLLYNQLVLHVNLGSSKIAYEFLSSLPLHIWLISFLCSAVVVSINLLVKRAEIKATIRQQRRARFDFNTKLGMNSPF